MLFSSVFLCVQKEPHNSFKCKEFQDFLEADFYFRNAICNGEKLNSHIMVSAPKILPSFIKKNYIHYKISNILLNVKLE